jgi:hypothetical protein
MNEKLRLDVNGLRVETFVAQETPTERGTVRANEEEASQNISCRTVCFTTPCCAPTVTCPTE